MYICMNKTHYTMKRFLIACLIALAFVFAGNAQVPYLTLNNGQKMPQLGIGTYGQTNDQAYAGVLHALRHGYRHIDTAHAYYDEDGVGRAIKDSGVPREEIWVTSKLWITDYSDGKTMGLDDINVAIASTQFKCDAEHSLTPENLVNQLPPFDRGFFKFLFTGSFYRKIYRLYEISKTF